MEQQDVRDTAPTRLFEGLPMERRQIEVAGITTSVLEGGAGHPLVLLHGGIQAGGVVWWRVVPTLLERHRVVVPDLPGLGASAALERLDAGAFSTWLAALLRVTPAVEATLVAHSAPGGLAARFSVEHGGLLRQLVLVDPAGLASFRPSPGFIMALLRATVRPSVPAAEAFLRRAGVDIDRVRADSGEQWDDLVAHLVSRSAVPHVKRAMRQLVKAGTTPLTDVELQQITAPTALIWGEADPMFPVQIARTASRAHGWPLQIIHDAGHLPHVEQPDAFAQALAALIDDA